jgi:hypothetical protein
METKFTRTNERMLPWKASADALEGETLKSNLCLLEYRVFYIPAAQHPT